VDEQNERPFPHSDITERVIAAFYVVHRELGYGFSESVYRRAMAVILRDGGLEAIEERLITVRF
jgi:GxxExxY protein